MNALSQIKFEINQSFIHNEDSSDWLLSNGSLLINKNVLFSNSISLIN